MFARNTRGRCPFCGGAPWIAARELQEKSVAALPLGRRKLKRNWGVVHWRNRRLTMAEETFISLCKAACSALNP